MDPCFAADRNLGKLAKWLRILGFDTLYESDISAGRFYEQVGPGRILLTRTEKNRKRFTTQRVIIVTSDHPMSQLREVLDETGITKDDVRLFSRCIRCNSAIDPIGKEDVYGLVPDYIWETCDKFQICRRCGRIYWKGSHWHRSWERVKWLFHTD